MIKLKQLFNEVVNENELFVRSDEHGVTVMYRTQGVLRGSVVSIDNIKPGEWWVSRALVNSDERGKRNWFDIIDKSHPRSDETRPKKQRLLPNLVEHMAAMNEDK